MSLSLEERTVSTMLDLIKIDSPSRDEGKIRLYLIEHLLALQLSVDVDSYGNMCARKAPTTGCEEVPPILLNCHMDTVQDAVGVIAIMEKGVVRSDGKTPLGADDKAGLAAILVALSELLIQKIPHGPIYVLITVAEELSLEGIKKYDLQVLNNIARGYTLDAMGEVGTVITSAPCKYDAHIQFHGKSAHAGFEPEKGINAIMLASRAIQRMKLERVSPHTTANLGMIHADGATNIVCDTCDVYLEVRSRTKEEVESHLEHLKECCSKAIEELGGSFEFSAVELYDGFSISEDSEELVYVKEVCDRLHLPFLPVETGGASDANVMRSYGLPVLTLGVGYTGAHSNSESIEIAELGKLTAFLIELVTYHH